MAGLISDMINKLKKKSKISRSLKKKKSNAMILQSVIKTVKYWMSGQNYTSIITSRAPKPSLVAEKKESARERANAADKKTAHLLSLPLTLEKKKYKARLSRRI